MQKTPFDYDEPSIRLSGIFRTKNIPVMTSPLYYCITQEIYEHMQKMKDNIKMSPCPETLTRRKMKAWQSNADVFNSPVHP